MNRLWCVMRWCCKTSLHFSAGSRQTAWVVAPSASCMPYALSAPNGLDLKTEPNFLKCLLISYTLDHLKLRVFFLAFWVVPALTNLALHFGLSLSYLLLDIRLLYPNFKKIFRAFIWTQLLEYFRSSKGKKLKVSVEKLCPSLESDEVGLSS